MGGRGLRVAEPARDAGAPAAGPDARVALGAYLPSRPDLVALFRLALPVATVQVGLLAMGTVDTIMVGRVSAVDIAAVALGNLYFFGAAVFGMGVLFALDPVISQAFGAGEGPGIARGVQRGGVLAAALTVLATLLLVPAGPLLTLLRQPPDVIPVATGYVLAQIPGVLPFYGFIVLRQGLQAMARVAPIVWTIALANLVNVFLNWVLIFGNLGFPPMGAVGSSWGTSASRWLMMLALLALGWPLLGPALRPLRRDALLVRPLARIVRVGAPIGAQQWLEFGVFGAAGVLMGWMGTVAMASHQVALNLAALTFMVPLGIAQATAVLVGQAVGAGDERGARRAAGAGLVTGVGTMVLTAALFLSLPDVLGRVYTNDAAVLAIAATLIPIAGVFQVFDGIQVVAAGALRGVADTRVPMIMNLVGFWGVGLPVSALMGFTLGVGPTGIWWGLAAGIGVVALLLLWRVRRRFGRELHRLVVDEEGGEA